MAYDYGMPNIANLIDFFNDNSHKKIIKYIGRDLLKTNKIRNKECAMKLVKQERNKQLTETFIKREESINNPSSGFESSKDSSSYNLIGETESILYDDVDNVKPTSFISTNESMVLEEEDDEEKKNKNIRQNPRTKQVTIDDQVEYLTNTQQSLNGQNLIDFDPRYELKVTSELNKTIVNRLAEKQTNYVSPNELLTRKDFSYKGFKIGFDISYVGDEKNERPYEIVNQKRPASQIDLTYLEAPFQRPKSILDSSKILRTKLNESPIPQSKSRLNESPFPRPKSNLKDSPTLRPRSIINESKISRPKSNLSNSVIRRSTFNDSTVREPRVSSRQINSRLDLLSSTLKRPLDQPLVFNNKFLPQANKILPNRGLLRSSTIRQMNISANKVLLNPNFDNAYSIQKIQPIEKPRTLSIKDSYLLKLRKSGLANEYCTPIIRPKQMGGALIATR